MRTYVHSGRAGCGSLDWSDQELLEHTLREVGMDMLIQPAAQTAPTEQVVEVQQACAGGHILLVADGALTATPDGDDLGWGSLVADSHRVLAMVHSNVSTMSSSPWAAEWADVSDLESSLGSRRARSKTPPAAAAWLRWASTGACPRRTAPRSTASGYQGSWPALPTHVCPARPSTAPVGTGFSPASKQRLGPMPWRPGACRGPAGRHICSWGCSTAPPSCSPGAAWSPWSPRLWTTRTRAKRHHSWRSSEDPRATHWLCMHGPAP